MIVVTLLLCINCVSQNVTKIHISKVKSEIKGIKYEYKVKDSTDLNFINIKYKEDMGHVTNVQYTLKENLPDGRYKVYLDKKLTQNGRIQNGFKEGIWITYNDKGEKWLTPYLKGKASGVIKEFYKDGSLKRETHVQANEVLFRTAFYKNGKVKTREQFKNGRCVELRKYNTKGKQIEADNG